MESYGSMRREMMRELHGLDPRPMRTGMEPLSSPWMMRSTILIYFVIYQIVP